MQTLCIVALLLKKKQHAFIVFVFIWILKFVLRFQMLSESSRCGLGLEVLVGWLGFDDYVKAPSLRVKPNASMLTGPVNAYLLIQNAYRDSPFECMLAEAGLRHG